MKPLQGRFFALPVILALTLTGCGGGGEEPAPTGPVGPKEKTPQERAKRLGEVAVDLVARMPNLSPRERTGLLMPLYAEYLKEDLRPNGAEDAEDYYERMCLGAWKSECEGVFPDDYEIIAVRHLLESLVEEYKTHESKLAMAGLSEAQKQLLETNAFEDLLKQVAPPAKGDRSPWIFIDHPVRRPKRQSGVVIGVVINEKGAVDVILNGKSQTEKGVLLTLPGSAPSSPPKNDLLVEALSTLKSQWTALVAQESKAAAEGKTVPYPPAGPMDGYVELIVRPNAPAWYIAWALAAFEEAEFDNAVLIVRANGDIPRLGIIPFPGARPVEKVVSIPVKKGGTYKEPKEPLSQKILAKLVPDNDVTAQELAMAADKLSGCQENPCDVMNSTFSVVKWDD